MNGTTNGVTKRLLDCGHTQPVKLGAGATWCPIDNEMVLVVDDGSTSAASADTSSQPAPVVRGTQAALAIARR